MPQPTLNQDFDATSTNLPNLNEVEEYALTDASTNSQQTVSSIKAPIVIKMQPREKSPSPQPILSTRLADLIFEDEKGLEPDPTTSSQKDVETVEETTEALSSSTISKVEKPESEILPIQTPPINPIYSSPLPFTTLAPSNPVVPPHYYPALVHHNVIYPYHLLPLTSNVLYPIQPNYYPPTMGVRYPAGGMHRYPTYPPVHHHAPPPPHQLLPNPHLPTNGYNMPGFHPQTNAPFTSTSTSTFITHHQPATQPISTTLSEDEFYIKQRYFQRIQRSPSARRRSHSSSYSSYSSSDSRSSSRSRYNRRCRSSRSQSLRRVRSPSRDNPCQRRSSSYRNRRQSMETKDKYSSKYRRFLPRPSRDQERCHSPRPSPIVQQST